MLRAAAWPMSSGGVGRAGEADPVDIGMLRERGAGVFADALHDVEHAGGDARRLGDVGHQRAGERRPFGGLTTTVLPAASAGPTFQVVSISGAFHGVTSTATPAGS